jgi:cytochrome b561
MSKPVAKRVWEGYCLILALLILFQIGLGWYMTGLDFYHRWYHSAPSLHKSTGLLIMAMTLVRVAARLKYGVPSMGTLLRSIRYNAFGAGHYVLYIHLVVVASAGYLFATSKGDPVSFFGLIDIPSLMQPGKGFRAFRTGFISSRPMQWRASFLFTVSR